MVDVKLIKSIGLSDNTINCDDVNSQSLRTYEQHALNNVEWRVISRVVSVYF